MTERNSFQAPSDLVSIADTRVSTSYVPDILQLLYIP